ncbi:hypothetical protein WICPIJ_005118 [Wickerhamomyces pijperi]|uniref:Uncharacterized protein n=1 Tax=Wickerhamomyces pijperi TaxID=599730 RepID=A0A9P8Q4H5_WICPI|nr:hypothetical protein WICPIJ_005118 [Wickerhamomyces pijperi]
MTILKFDNWNKAALNCSNSALICSNSPASNFSNKPLVQNTLDQDLNTGFLPNGVVHNLTDPFDDLHVVGFQSLDLQSDGLRELVVETGVQSSENCIVLDLLNDGFVVDVFTIHVHR